MVIIDDNLVITEVSLMTRISHPLIPGLAFGGCADDHRARMRLLIGLKGGEET